MSDNGDKPDGQSSAPSPETPEVEAEIVTEEELIVDAATESGDAFDDTDDVVPPPRKSTLTLGVIFFILFAVAAVVIFAVWRFQSGGSDPQLAAHTPAESTIETLQTSVDDASTQTVEDTIAPVSSADTVVTTNETNTPTTLEASDADAERGESDLAGDEVLSETLLPEDDMDEPPSDVATTENHALLNEHTDDDGAGVLDPLSAEEVGLVVSDAADELDATDMFEEAAAPNASASDDDSMAASVDIGEIGTGLGDPIGADQPEVIEQEASLIEDFGNSETDPAENDAAVIDEVVPDGAAGDDAQAVETMVPQQKIDNDDVQDIKDSFSAEIARLEAALATEREQNASQRDQIGEMRRNFQAALAARDRAANQQLSDFNARLDKIENGSAVEGGRRAAAALALNALRRVAEEGEPFVNELEVLMGYIPQGQEIATLRRYADTEIPVANELKTAFSSAARESLAAAGREEKNGFSEKLSARISSLVSVRPAEPIQGDSARAIISRAEAFIDAGDISSAADELDALLGGARAAMAGWLDHAQSRIFVDDAIASLGSRLAAPVR